MITKHIGIIINGLILMFHIPSNGIKRCIRYNPNVISENFNINLLTESVFDLNIFSKLMFLIIKNIPIVLNTELGAK